jgi:hypothetical protein
MKWQFVVGVVLLVMLGGPVPSAQAARSPQRTANFVFHFPPTAANAAAGLIRIAEAERASLCVLYDPCPRGPFEVRLFSTLDSFLEAQPPGSHLDWATGLAYPDGRVMHLRLDKGLLLSLEETFKHELSHLMLYAATGHQPPRWYTEGLSILQAREDLIGRFEAAAGAAVTDSLLPLEDLSRAFGGGTAERGLAYAQSALFVRRLHDQHGDGAFIQLHAGLVEGKSFSLAFKEAFGLHLREAFDAWAGSLDLPALGWLLQNDWWLWTAAGLLFALAFAKVLWKKRRDRRNAPPPEEDWEWRR